MARVEDLSPEEQARRKAREENKARATTVALTPESVARIDWSNERQPPNHAIRQRVECGADGRWRVYDLKTNQLVETGEPGYYPYWNHSHMHWAPVGWDTKSGADNITVLPSHKVVENPTISEMNDPDRLHQWAKQINIGVDVPESTVNALLDLVKKVAASGA